MNELLDLTHDYSKPKQENYSDSLDHSACSVLISAQLCHSQKKGRRCESLLVFFSILFPDRLYVFFFFNSRFRLNLLLQDKRQCPYFSIR